jgi:hypothetical protein
LNYGDFEGYPCCWTDARAWIRFTRQWREFLLADVMQKVRPLSAVEFKRAFPRLPPVIRLVRSSAELRACRP